MATEWFRNCVCNLVSGVVHDIGQMAFEDQGMNACMYLEPDDYDPFDVPSYTTAPSRNKSSRYFPRGGDDYYGVRQIQTQQNNQSSPVLVAHSNHFHPAAVAPRPLPLRHEVAQGYVALEQLATSQDDTAARADFIQSTKRLRNASEPICADDQETLLKRPAKKARHDSSPTRPSPLSAGSAVSAPDAASKVQKNFRWTDEEVNILVTARDFGQSWGEVGNVSTAHGDPADSKSELRFSNSS